MLSLFNPRIVRPRFWFAPTRHLAVVDASSFHQHDNDPQHQRMMLHQRQRLLAPTQAWFETVVIGQKLCPFAAPLVAGNSKK